MNRHGILLVPFCGLLAFMPAIAEEKYWDGTSGRWNDASGWTLDKSLPSSNPASAPGSGDTAVFNADGVSGLQNVVIDGEAAVSGIRVNSGAADGVLLSGGGSGAALSVGAEGIVSEEGAGTFVIGEDVSVSVSGGQLWNNASQQPVVIDGSVVFPSSASLSITNGCFFLYGSNVVENTIQVWTGGILGVGSDYALGTAKITTPGGSIEFSGRPVRIGNKISILNNKLSGILIGDAPAELCGTDGAAAVAVAQYSNQSLALRGTAPVRITGPYAISDTSGSCNNNAVGVSLDSGGDVSLEGGIFDNNSLTLNPTYSGSNPGFYIGFKGDAGIVRIYGSNEFCDARNVTNETAKMSSRVAINGLSAANTISIGRRDGEPMEIKPFGVAGLFSNSGAPVFLESMEDGLVIGNSLILGGSANNDGGTPFNFSGEHSMNVSGDYIVYPSTGGVSFYNTASAPLTFDGTIKVKTKSVTFRGDGTTVLSGSSTYTAGDGNTGGLQKNGAGTLEIAGEVEAGTATFQGGTTVLNYAESESTKIGSATNNASALIIGGTDLVLKGGSFVQTLGAGSGTKFVNGQSRIRRDGGASTIDLGEITFTTGDGIWVDFEEGAARTSSANGSSGILKGYSCATVGGSNWAAADENGFIVPVNDYTTFSEMSGNKHILATETSETIPNGSSVYINTLKADTSNTGIDITKNDTGTLVIQCGGLMMTGGNDLTISGGKIKGWNSHPGDLIIVQNGTGKMTLNSSVTGYRLTKAGPGTLVLACTNEFNNQFSLIGGAVEISDEYQLGKGGTKSVLNGGAIVTRTDMEIANHPVTIGPNGAEYNTVDGTLSISSVISSSGTLIKTGPGTLVLSGNNTYSGETRIEDGVLALGQDNSLGSAATSQRSFSPVVVSGGTLDIAGFNPQIGVLRLEGGTVCDSVGGGTLGAYEFVLKEGVVGVCLSNSTVRSKDSKVNARKVRKEGDGTVLISADCGYTGTTCVSGGRLDVEAALSSCSAIVSDGGILSGSGSIDGSVHVIDGGIFCPGSYGSGVFEVSGNVALTEGGVFRASIKNDSFGSVRLTSPDSRVYLDGGTLELDLESVSASAFASGIKIIDNEGIFPIYGEFANCPAGERVSIGNGRTMMVVYDGGDGNDVIATKTDMGVMVILK